MSSSAATTATTTTMESGLAPPYASQALGSPDSTGRYISPELLSSGYFPEDCSDEDRRILLSEPPYPSDLASSTGPGPSYWPYAAHDPALYPSAADPAAVSAAASYGGLPSSHHSHHHHHHPHAGMSTTTTQGQYFPSMPATAPGMMKAEPGFDGSTGTLFAEHDLLHSYGGFNDALMAGVDLQFAPLDHHQHHQHHPGSKQPVNLPRVYRR